MIRGACINFFGKKDLSTRNVEYLLELRKSIQDALVSEPPTHPSVFTSKTKQIAACCASSFDERVSHCRKILLILNSDNHCLTLTHSDSFFLWTLRTI